MGVLAALDIRNVAIIAHVDHGKTTLVDAILKQTGVFRANEQVEERVLDSNAIERERGITILAKNTAVFYKDVKINIVDTPGHADFGGEVERILSMVDGALLVVDAFEGPMPQTRFVLQKAMLHHVRPILVVNKIDRPGARITEVVDEVLDLFISLGASDEYMDFPVLYTSARAGIALREPPRPGEQVKGTILPLLDTILEYVPAPGGDVTAPLQILVTTLDYDDYIGRIAIGRVHNGVVREGQTVAIARGGSNAPAREAKVAALFTFASLKRVRTEEATAGDVVAAALSEDINIGDTITDPEHVVPLPPVQVDEPTVTMTFRVNDSPFAGREGIYVTSRHLRDRLFREMKTDVALRVEETDSPDTFVVAGRGELHLGILLETMRREGYEVAVSKPEVITREIDGETYEPFEDLVVDVPEEYMGVVMEELGRRRADLVNMANSTAGHVRLEFVVPARGLIGYRSQFLTDTRGTGVMYHTFRGWDKSRGPIPGRTHGSLVAWEDGVTTAYALHNAEERGTLFLGPGEEVYMGQVVGEHARPGDLDINVCKQRHVSNVRSSTREEPIRLEPPRVLSLDEALEYIGDDELVEVTPKSVRVRKIVLDRTQRNRIARGLPPVRAGLTQD